MCDKNCTEEKPKPRNVHLLQQDNRGTLVFTASFESVEQAKDHAEKSLRNYPHVIYVIAPAKFTIRTGNPIVQEV
jgi:hypothetical protein